MDTCTFCGLPASIVRTFRPDAGGPEQDAPCCADCAATSPLDMTEVVK